MSATQRSHEMHGAYDRFFLQRRFDLKDGSKDGSATGASTKRRDGGSE
jgi:hypothetical protein